MAISRHRPASFCEDFSAMSWQRHPLTDGNTTYKIAA
jgi:hypothetical protein